MQNLRTANKYLYKYVTNIDAFGNKFQEKYKFLLYICAYRISEDIVQNLYSWKIK